MTRPPRPYDGAQVVFGTMHGKAELARDPFRNILGADVVMPASLDTDQFGTFTGEKPRTLSPHDSARAKARLGMQITGMPYGLASEGSFNTDFGYLVEHQEILIFIDDRIGLELVDGQSCVSPLPPASTVDSVEGALRYATAIDFPRQKLVVRTAEGPTLLDRGTVLNKGVESFDKLKVIVEQQIQTVGRVTLEPDFRAHYCPSRAKQISSLAISMAKRLATPCPSCEAPGFGQVNVERGLSCRDCLLPTRSITADIDGCGICDFTARRPRPERFAEPDRCDHCNP